MLIIGCDFHPGFQQVAIFDKGTGEVTEKRLAHRAEAEEFYRSLAGQEVRVGMEACGHYPWFEQLLAERRKAAAGSDQQTGQFVFALFAGGSRTDGGALRSAAETLLSPPGGAQEPRRGQKVAVARKLATRLYLMLREDWTYPQLCQAIMQASPSHSVERKRQPGL